MKPDSDTTGPARPASLLLLALLIFTAMVGCGAVLLWQFILPAQWAQEAALQEIAALENRVAELEKRPIAQETPNLPALAAMQEDIRVLQAEAHDRPDVSMLQNTIIELQQRLAALERHSPSEEEVKRLLSALSLYEKMNDEIDRGIPFESTLNELSALYAGDEAFSAAVAPLKPYAAGGIPPLSLLQETYVQALRSVTAPPEEGGGIWQKFKNNLASLVTVRKIGTEHAGTDDDSILARAETYVMQGDLPRALSELDGLSGQAANDMKEWLDNARARVQVADWRRQIRAQIFRTHMDQR